MALRINTNVAALSAHKNMIRNDNALSASLEKLSSGLRINRAADDASGMAIADSLKSQALGLGQAIRNANDGISMVQTADGALDESIKIINSIKTKAIQAAQDGQTTDSRKAIQSDISKLMQELDMIARTTAFNNQKLLSGNFTNKKFQVGAYSGETVNISIGSSESNKIGHVTTGNLSLTNISGGMVQLSVYSNLQNETFTIQAVDIKNNNSVENGMGALADAINKLSDVLGISADAVVESESSNSVAAGETSSDFSINGVSIGTVTVADNDADGALVKAINNKSADHGIIASTSADGKLKLTSIDKRAVEVTGGTGDVLAGTNMSNFGYVQLKQQGSNELLITDLASGVAVNFTSNVDLKNDVTTSIDSTLGAGSIIESASVWATGSSLGVDMGGQDFNGTIDTTVDSTILSGSVLSSSSVIEKGTVLGGTAALRATATTTTDSLLKAGSKLVHHSVLEAGTVVTTNFYADGGSLVTAGSVLSVDTTISGDITLASDMIALKDSSFIISSNFTAGSHIGVDITISSLMTLTEDMTLLAGSTIVDDNEPGTGVNLKAGSVIGGNVTTSETQTLTRSATLKSGSIIQSQSKLSKGSTIGGDITLSNIETAAADITLAAGSVLASATLLKQGTVLTNDIIVSGGTTITAGTVLEQDYYTKEDTENSLTYDMTIKKDSALASGSTMAANAGGASGTKVSDTEMTRLSDLNVLTQEGAQTAIAVADSALKDLDKVRSDLGSVQNQLTSTISNLSVTRVNIFAAESSIRDVDFAEEAATFSRMQILTQASSFAMAQANASSQTVLSLLQG